MKNDLRPSKEYQVFDQRNSTCKIDFVVPLELRNAKSGLMYIHMNIYSNPCIDVIINMNKFVITTHTGDPTNNFHIWSNVCIPYNELLLDQMNTIFIRPSKDKFDFVFHP